MADTDKRDEAVEHIRDVYAHRKPDVSAGKRSWEDRLRRYDDALSETGLTPLDKARVLDVGCLNGGWLNLACSRWGARPENCVGVDLQEGKILAGREAFPGIDLRVGSADQLADTDGTFDIVHQSMVLSSVMDTSLREGIAAEVVRMLKPGGHIIWSDFILNPLNRNAKGIGKRKMLALFPEAEVKYVRRHRFGSPIGAPAGSLLCPSRDGLGATEAAKHVLSGRAAEEDLDD